MDDRFDQTGAEARAAIDRACAREAAAHRRRLEVDERIEALRRPGLGYLTAAQGPRLDEARERLEQAQQSCAQARERADRAVARHPAPAA